jgi:basic membrane protein A
VIRHLVSEGNKLVFGTTFGYMDPMLKVAADHKDVKFEHGTGFKTAANMRTYDARTYEGAYMAGVIAGSMTKTNTLGVVGSIPIPEVIRNINSFTLGAQSVNPKIKTKVVWVNAWFDPPKETEGAQSLLNQGADVLFQNTDSTAVLQTAEKAGKYAFGWDSNMSHFGPRRPTWPRPSSTGARTTSRPPRKPWTAPGRPVACGGASRKARSTWSASV